MSSTRNLTEKRRKKIPYLIAFILKCVDWTMRSNDDSSALLPSFLGCPAISPTGAALGRFSKPTASSSTAVLLELMGRTRGA